jgi:hypothetical protein
LPEVAGLNSWLSYRELVPHRGNGIARKLEMAYLAWSRL